MSIILEYGVNKVKFMIQTREELVKQGYFLNRNTYIGSGYMFCPPCAQYTHFYAMSKSGQSTFKAVCYECHNAHEPA